MNKRLLLSIIAILIYGFAQQQGFSIPGLSIPTGNAEQSLQNAYDNQQSDLQIQGEGIVAKLLRDDLKGSKHQRFILKTATGQALLVAHNIDLAPKIKHLKKGDTVAFYGEYEWNAKGGVIHWTHRDPGHRHINGWLKHHGKTYQ